LRLALRGLGDGAADQLLAGAGIGALGRDALFDDALGHHALGAGGFGNVNRAATHDGTAARAGAEFRQGHLYRHTDISSRYRRPAGRSSDEAARELPMNSQCRTKN
jgi:hypothetical protein